MIVEKDFFTMCISELSLAFIQKLSIGRHPEVEKWDLESRNCMSLVSSWRLKHLRLTDNNIFLFDFNSSLYIKWKLAVSCATDALYVCRLDSRLDNYKVTRLLLQQGIRFHTLCPLMKAPFAPVPSTPLTHILPIRLSEYTFTLKDYEAYIWQCSTIFNQPWGHALLFQGGIVWRLAVELLSWDDALREPSLFATFHGSGFSIKDPNANGWLIDDDLMEQELDLICGTYQCYTGMCLHNESFIFDEVV
jgi:hypothetical protein